MADEKPVTDVLKDLLEESNAGCVKIVIRDKRGNPIRCYIGVDGREECAEVIAAVERVEEGWE